MTSTTPNAAENNFYSADSGFNTPLKLRLCSLYNEKDIGLLKDPQNAHGNAVLDAIFDELNAAFSSASNEGRTLESKSFYSREEMEDYVEDMDYREHSMCFALGWSKFEPENNEFVIDFSYNFGDLYENRQPQTYYENSAFCNYFLW